jgi:Family of unknown function (DUF6081)
MKTKYFAFVCLLLTGLLANQISAQTTTQGNTTTVVYDSFEKPGGYNINDYYAKWTNSFGPGEMAINDTRLFQNGKFSIDAAPFQTAYDFSVYDHIKYLAVSNQSFAVPQKGSITFSAQIDAETPGTIPNHVIHGTYIQSGAPYSAAVLQGQQAGATLHMVDFYTGQLFDWFVSGNTAFTLIERLPSSITGSPLYAGRDKMYTQIIDEVQITPGPHTVEIRYTRKPNKAVVEFFLDGRRISKVENIGIPLDKQGVSYTGIYPSLGNGELLKDQFNSVTMAHGLFSLLDAFPFQHPEAPELSVSIPVENRIFGQGARAKFDNFVVTTKKD